MVIQRIDFARDPGECAQPRRQLVHVEPLSRRERVEIAGHQVQTVLVALDAAKQRAQLVRAPLLGEVAVHGAEMHAVDAEARRDVTISRYARLAQRTRRQTWPAISTRLMKATEWPGEDAQCVIPHFSASCSNDRGRYAS